MTLPLKRAEPLAELPLAGDLTTSSHVEMPPSKRLKLTIPPDACLAPATAAREGKPIRTAAKPNSRRQRALKHRRRLRCFICTDTTTDYLLPLACQPKGMNPPSYGGEWQAHRDCASILNETWVGKDEIHVGDDIVFGVESVDPARYTLRCAACSELPLSSHGPKVQCNFNHKCTISYHTSCAMHSEDIAFEAHNRDVFEASEDESFLGTDLIYKLLCKKHTKICHPDLGLFPRAVSPAFEERIFDLSLPINKENAGFPSPKQTESLPINTSLPTPPNSHYGSHTVSPISEILSLAPPPVEFDSYTGLGEWDSEGQEISSRLIGTREDRTNPQIGQPPTELELESGPSVVHKADSPVYEPLTPVSELRFDGYRPADEEEEPVDRPTLDCVKSVAEDAFPTPQSELGGWTPSTESSPQISVNQIEMQSELNAEEETNDPLSLMDASFDIRTHLDAIRAELLDSEEDVDQVDWEEVWSRPASQVLKDYLMNLFSSGDGPLCL